MKIEVRESFPGELDSMEPSDIELKLHEALHAVADQIIKARKPHEGVPTIKALDTIAEQMAGLYEARMRKMMTDAAKYDPAEYLDFTG